MKISPVFTHYCVCALYADPRTAVMSFLEDVTWLKPISETPVVMSYLSTRMLHAEKVMLNEVTDLLVKAIQHYPLTCDDPRHGMPLFGVSKEVEQSEQNSISAQRQICTVCQCIIGTIKVEPHVESLLRCGILMGSVSSSTLLYALLQSISRYLSKMFQLHNMQTNLGLACLGRLDVTFLATLYHQKFTRLLHRLPDWELFSYGYPDFVLTVKGDVTIGVISCVSEHKDLDNQIYQQLALSACGCMSRNEPF